MEYNNDMIFDIVVVGAGHAGIEAGVICAKMGMKTLVLNINLDTVGWASCNPAIGGPAKGVVAREVDVLGGVMAKVTDSTMINVRMLNTSKGIAVRALRAQIDKYEYSREMKRILESTDNLYLRYGVAREILIESGKVKGLVTEFGMKYECRAVILTTGTFLGGKLFIGREVQYGGRLGELPANGLTQNLIDHGIKMERFKTGTPARIRRDSIDFSKMDIQETSSEPQAFSFFSKKKILSPEYPCWLTRTNNNTHDVIRKYISFSPLYGDVKLVQGKGPRYCPSIEDKVMKFDKQSHQIFVEPESRFSQEYYLNGLSTSLPFEAQIGIIRSINGLENAVIERPAYAVEYDYACPDQLFPTLESKKIENLYFAGQINGTSGYEEAAGQGVVAGINAAAKFKGMKPLILRRDESYIGVMIDDIINKSVDEPYRLLTSRAEFRLLLRHDNVHLRLARYGYEYGLISQEFYSSVQEIEKEVNLNIQRISRINVYPSAVNDILISYSTEPIEHTMKLGDILKRPQIPYEALKKLDSIPIQNDEIAEQTDIYFKYGGYLKKMEDEVKKMKKMEEIIISDGFDYDQVHNLAFEAREKLKKIKPATIAQAMRIPGINPSDILNLSVYVNKK
ncbi:MAG: tRNA uridine-5-carboxymethylaminomethyl(34) synthesis enzyme MnmG [Petrotogaceae bacterium]|jgi:tRNA uridine 5-carboxymethylaminomethyl modification enzyme|nr:tRNA uridine-5-carboxymethylaminomethyl(34) synthesis enzyme MnmG [Petrotogaceae bacterium]